MTQNTVSKKNLEQIQWFDNRFYKYEHDGEIEYFPSVTTILGDASPKPDLAYWRGMIGNREADLVIKDAGDRGTRIHEAIEAYMKGEEISYEDMEQEEYYQVLKYTYLEKELLPIDLATEMNVYSVEHKYAGTLDFIWVLEPGEYDLGAVKKVELPAGKYIVDIKTSKSIHSDHFRQIAAYMRAVEEMGLHDVVGGLIVHTNAKTKKGYKAIYSNREQLNNYLDEFDLIHKLWLKQFQKFPNVFEMPKSLRRSNEISTHKES